MTTNNKPKPCPRCGQPIYTFPALSRVDNRTEICSDCGTTEALIAFTRALPKKPRKDEK
jgi:hypothetical protein